MNMLRALSILPLLCKKLIFLKNGLKYPAGEVRLAIFANLSQK